MNDIDLLTLQAFIAAYEANERPPIPKLAEIQADLDNRVGELDVIARNHGQLCDDYKQARIFLGRAAGMHIAGLNFIPELPEDDGSKDVENSCRILSQKSKKELQSKLAEENE